MPTNTPEATDRLDAKENRMTNPLTLLASRVEEAMVKNVESALSQQPGTIRTAHRQAAAEWATVAAALRALAAQQETSRGLLD